ncbi:MAG TPA: hypothetical protein VK766_04210 [Cytophagaceae bacterium]|jgi:hypothetical protein|nr:hypothetical protein [Cytophagaceae bacterium]
MLDLIILFFLVKRIVAYAKVKGQKGLKWGTLLVLNWFMFEMLGISLATYLLNIQFTFNFVQSNPGYALLLSFFGIGCGFLGYFLTRRMLDRLIV